MGNLVFASLHQVFAMSRKWRDNLFLTSHGKMEHPRLHRTQTFLRSFHLSNDNLFHALKAAERRALAELKKPGKQEATSEKHPNQDDH